MIHLLYAALFYYVNAPVTDMRELPKQTAEIVSQGYFSEEVQVLEESDGWVKIKTIVDNYQGWVPKNVICERTTPFLSDPDATIVKINRCSAHIYAVADTIYGPILTLPFDSKLEVLENTSEFNSRWIKVKLIDGTQGYVQRGDVSADFSPLNCEQMCNLSHQFLNLPYTWGGRSSFGYDCSGFVQMLYRQMGIHLPRDSKDQISWEGFVPVAIDDLLPGDLIFLGLIENKIRHVGLYLGKQQFIHATVSENAPYIHISKLSDPEWNGTGKWGYRAARTIKNKKKS